MSERVYALRFTINKYKCSELEDMEIRLEIANHVLEIKDNLKKRYSGRADIGLMEI